MEEVPLNWWRAKALDPSRLATYVANQELEKNRAFALAEIAALFPGKPIVLTEFGTIGIPGSGGDVRFSEDYQSAYLSAVWRAPGGLARVYLVPSAILS